MTGDGRGLVLVCDDEPHIVQVVAAKLRNAGFEVHTAADGEEAYEHAARLRPLLVVTDYQMPRLSGVEVARRLRRRPETAALPIVLLTARGLSLDRSELADTNIRMVMCKPFSPREILKSVEQLLVETNGAAPAPAAVAAARV
jgi:two-component system phosphate regulon response regulator PhoB